MRQFTARIYKVGINPCVDVPAGISQAFARRGYVPVRVALGEKSFRTTLVPVGGGRHRLCLNQLMRDAADRETGDRVKVRLELDTTSRTLVAPADLTRAMRGAGRMKEFLADTPSHRKEIIRWVGGTKNPATRQRRIAKAVEYFNKPGLSVADRQGRRGS